MEIWPSLDLMGGKVVRLVKGDPLKSIVYSDDPLKVALNWQRVRVSGLHIIDLDAALQIGNNIEVIQEIVKNTNLPTQLGGGIRSINSIKAAFKLGVERVIVGTALFTNKLDPIELLKFGSDKVVVAIDHINGRIAISGWRTKLSLQLSPSIQKLWNQGFRLFLSTSASRDGTLKGCDKSHLIKIEQFLPYTYIAGGISSLEDLHFLKNKNVKGAILGRAIYDGVIKIEEAMEVAGLASR